MLTANLCLQTMMRGEQARPLRFCEIKLGVQGGVGINGTPSLDFISTGASIGEASGNKSRVSCIIGLKISF